MLVLSRKASQSITIGGTIEVTVLRIDGSTVRLGITAPPDVRIIRNELEEKPKKTDGPPTERP
jgi:carbon storage regulator